MLKLKWKQHESGRGEKARFLRCKEEQSALRKGEEVRTLDRIAALEKVLAQLAAQLDAWRAEGLAGTSSLKNSSLKTAR